MKSIIIRVDSSLSIGSGHVMRCRTLAKQLQNSGAEIYFLCRPKKADLISFLKLDFTVLVLPEYSTVSPAVSDETSLIGRDLYVSWLGCSEEQDASDCSELLNQSGLLDIDWIIVDHYSLGAEWESAMINSFDPSKVPKIMVIDDLADRVHLADCLLDQSYFGLQTQHRYRDLVNVQCRQFLGPHFALLSPEYPCLHPLIPDRRSLNRVLIFFGGSDPLNLTTRALKAFLELGLPHIFLDVVIGSQSPFKEEIVKLVSRLSSATLHHSLPSLAGLICRADLAIGSSGSTSWERACLGLPSLVVTCADNQVPIAESMNDEGLIHYLGPAETVTVNILKEAIKKSVLAFSHGSLPDSGRWLTDGWGTLRVSTFLLGPQLPLSLRPATINDEALILRWSNDPQVRSLSLSTDLISSSDHHDWFISSLKNPNRLLFIAIDPTGCPLGQMRFDRVKVSHTSSNYHVLISFSLDRCARGFGLASDFVIHGLEALQSKWGSSLQVIAEVLEENLPSQATFARVGFTKDITLHQNLSRKVTRWVWRSSDSC
ncbi:MAG: UDP-2,4-diacetamido-2,4,6-trideoxy-beta-L-altropyranose hydrolase [Rhodopirellula sp.]|nr:UDP-2,4-diacetamido-2,4,6-trideoxy-beta-L-altropyranose hydrolase [Rhodopirellula sp.]